MQLIYKAIIKKFDKITNWKKIISRLIENINTSPQTIMKIYQKDFHYLSKEYFYKNYLRNQNTPQIIIKKIWEDDHTKTKINAVFPNYFSLPLNKNISEEFQKTLIMSYSKI